MPTYEYSCRECGERLEAVQGFYDEPLTTCEACGGDLRKVFTPAGIIFKGSGYYVTDTRNEREQARKGKSKSADDGDGSSSASDSDSGSGDDAGSGDSGSSSSETSSTSGSGSGGESESAA